LAEAEIIARRRKWSAEQKAALLSEVEAEGGRVAVVARRHGLSESLLYNWRSSWQVTSSETSHGKTRRCRRETFGPCSPAVACCWQTAAVSAAHHLPHCRRPSFPRARSVTS
jgi:transposase-like protein